MVIFSFDPGNAAVEMYSSSFTSVGSKSHCPCLIASNTDSRTTNSFLDQSFKFLASPPQKTIHEKHVVNPEARQPLKACLIAIRKFNRQSQTKIAKEQKLASLAQHSTMIDKHSLRVD
jgi:hypothetical protein